MSTECTASQDVSLCDLLDRLLYTGVVVRGDVTISVADVDLVYLQLNLLLTSIAKMTSILAPSTKDEGIDGQR
ncbi:MAG TPA: gas vesicle protein [Oculatellaceae cyanobacterium]